MKQIKLKNSHIFRRMRKNRAKARKKLTSLSRRILSSLRILRRRQTRTGPGSSDNVITTDMGSGPLAHNDVPGAVPILTPPPPPPYTPSLSPQTPLSSPSPSPSLVSSCCYSEDDEYESVFDSDTDYDGDEEDNVDYLSSSSETVFNDEDSNDDDDEEEETESEEEPTITKTTTCFGGAVTLMTEEEEDDSGQEYHHHLSNTDYSSQDYSFQDWEWEVMLECAVQQCNYRDGPALSRTSSEEELAAIFGNRNIKPSHSTTTPSKEFTTKVVVNDSDKESVNAHVLRMNYGFQQSGHYSNGLSFLHQSEQPFPTYSTQPIINQTEETPVITEPYTTPPTLSPEQPETSETASRDLSPPSSPPHLTPPTSPPSDPSTLERMWEEYAAKHRTSPQYFIFPPFTPDQEQWVVQVNHPFKDHVLSTWQNQIHSSVENSLAHLIE